MKKRISVILVFCMLLGLAACGGEEPETAMETLAAQTETEIPETISVPETTEAPVEGELFLTVSQITFSIVGESEDIYVGTVPRDRITWESGDESVITVVDGVLTAVGVGSTTVTATCQGQAFSCEAACLAEDRESLAALPKEVLRSPKRMAVQVSDDVLSFYEDAVMVGDSITYGFMKYEARNGRLGSPRCLCRGSLGIHNMLTHELDLIYQGAPTAFDDVIAAVAPGKVFILLGTNDVMIRSADFVLGELDQLLDGVLEKSPDVEIYLQSVFPIVNEDINSGNSVNKRITAYNEQLEIFAQERGYHYVPVAPYLQDHIPGFALKYEQDTYHPSYEGVCAWTDALRAYAYTEILKGEME